MSAHEHESTTTTTFRAGIANADPTIAYRLVGTYEYKNCLDLLQKLISQSTSEQIEIYDRMLEDRPEFSFYNGTSLLDSQLLRELDFGNKADRTRFDDEFKRKGLSWMMALAKVELGATISAYGSATTPFAVFAPNSLDLVPFCNIMLDDLAAHMQALSTDTALQEVMRRGRTADSWTVAYLRRVKLLRDIIQTLKRVDDPTIAYRLEPHDQELRRLSQRLIQNIMSYEVTQVDTKHSTRTFNRKSGDFSGPRCEALISQIQTAEGSR